MFTQQFFVEGLGCASYLVGCEQAGQAAVIDPDRDIQKYLQAAEQRGVQVTHILETHLHADHVSGNLELAGRTGATVYLHEAAQAAFEHQPLKDGDVLEIGNVRLKVLHTPGHTPESITLLVSDQTRSSQPWLALTGDTLFVGDIGRPDLVGQDAALQLAGQMYDSLQNQISTLADGLLIYPGHGAGSLCGKSIGAMRSTTLGYERKTNDALQARDRESFVQFATNNLPEQPGNHQRIKALNRQGPSALGEIKPLALSTRESIPLFQSGAAMLDTRSKEYYVEKHVPGAVHLEADEQLSNRIGFILPPRVPIVLLLENEKQYREVFMSLARVGYDQQVAGYLSEGIQGWEAMGFPVTSGDIEDINPIDLQDLIVNGNGARPVVLDVREPWEYRQGHIPGARLIPLGELNSHLNELDPEQPIAVVCATGSRSQSAAALLGQKDFKKVYNVLHGMTGWSQQGLPVEH
jgi:hydroxyacylglutathione hydrolase